MCSINPLVAISNAIFHPLHMPIIRVLGNTVRKYVRNGGVVEYRQSAPRKGILSGMEEWLKAKFLQHQGNADVIRQELAEKDVKVSLRTVERAVKAYRDELTRKTKATVRFETLPGQQMQIDFGEKLVKIGGEKIKVVRVRRK